MNFESLDLSNLNQKMPKINNPAIWIGISTRNLLATRNGSGQRCYVISQIFRGSERTKPWEVTFEVRSRHRRGHLPCQACTTLPRISYETSFNPRCGQETVRSEHYPTFILTNSFACRRRNSKRQTSLLRRPPGSQFKDDARPVRLAKTRHNLSIDRARNVLFNIGL